MVAVATLWVFRDRIGQKDFTHLLTKRAKNVQHCCGLLWQQTCQTTQLPQINLAFYHKSLPVLCCFSTPILKSQFSNSVLPTKSSGSFRSNPTPSSDHTTPSSPVRFSIPSPVFLRHLMSTILTSSNTFFPKHQLTLVLALRISTPGLSHPSTSIYPSWN